MWLMNASTMQCDNLVSGNHWRHDTADMLGIHYIIIVSIYFCIFLVFYLRLHQPLHVSIWGPALSIKYLASHCHCLTQLADITMRQMRHYELTPVRPGADENTGNENCNCEHNASHAVIRHAGTRCLSPSSTFCKQWARKCFTIPIFRLSAAGPSSV